MNEKGEYNYDSKFTIIAVPRNPKKYLRTFAINDLQTPLVWIGSDFRMEKRDDVAE